MKKFILKICMFTLLGISMPSHSQLFWQDTTYGMNVYEVNKLHPKAFAVENGETLIDGAKVLLKIKDFQIFQNEFDVNFFFKDKKLTQVMIALSQHQTPTIQLLNQIENLLNNTYGKPVNRNVSMNKANAMSAGQIIWKNQKTNISIFFIFAGLGSNIFNINYQLMDEAGKL